jgi:hypothetical protein
VAARQALLHRAREGDARVVHSERRANARDDELLIAFAGAELEDMAQQAEAQIGIFVMLARLEAELVVRQAVVEPLGRVIDVRIVRIFRREVRRHPRQARCVGRKIKQRDWRAFEIGHPDAGRQIFRRRVVRRHLAAQHHVGEQQRGEHFCD